jgi:hypothetical protein
MDRADDTHSLFDIVWKHPHFDNALRLATTYASLSAPGSMVLLVGASGSGKTTLLKQLGTRLVGDRVVAVNTGDVPVVAASVANDVNGLFSSKNFAVRLLDAVVHPFYGSAQALRGFEIGPREINSGAIRISSSEPQLRLALESALIHRKTRYIFLDEAQHLLKTGTVQAAVNHLDSIKGLAERTGVTIVLAGTFEILPIWNRSAQLNRRLQDVVLHRYRSDSDNEMLAFERILESFSQKLPMASPLSLRDMNAFIYPQTLGIIGEIVRLIVGARAHMMASNLSHLTRECILKAGHSSQKIATLNRETLAGEAMLSGEIAQIEASSLSRAEVKSKPSRRRGKRLAVRDAVGNRSHVIDRSGE